MIIGAGVAGLWLLNLLKASGYSALLLENARIGGGQTVASQGIIHGGLKYALDGVIGDATRALSEMPDRWRQALRGEGAVNLSMAQVNAPYGHFWADGLSGSLFGKLSASLLSSAAIRLNQQDWPVALRAGGGRRQVWQVSEPIVDVPSLLRALTMPVLDKIIKIAPDGLNVAPGAVDIEADDGRRAQIHCRRLFATAGVGNEALLHRLSMPSYQPQWRPLHMLMAKGSLPPLFGHALGFSRRPKLTITSHKAADGETVWYLGGELAETGAALSAAQLIERGRTLLAELLPADQVGALRFAPLRIDRAEAKGIAGARPDHASWIGDDWARIGWPNKLTLAPELAAQALTDLRVDGILPRGEEAPPSLGWPLPAFAPPPWDEVTEWI